MDFVFDLISDLHIQPDEEFDWSGRQTALYCVVVGDVARDRETLLRVLRHLCSCYYGVIYVDGNDEHREFYPYLKTSYAELQDGLSKIPGLIYLHKNILVLGKTAVVGANGWWTYAFNARLDYDRSVDWFVQETNTSVEFAQEVLTRAYSDAAYMSASIRQLQKHADIEQIVCVSHTVPLSLLTDHDVSIVDELRYNCLGNQHLAHAVGEDHGNKLVLWCFGHYHRMVDRQIGSVRFLCNPRGKADTPWHQANYNAVRVELTQAAQK